MANDEWPMLLDYGEDDCHRLLRKIELEAYSNLLSAFRAQGELTTEKKKLLKDMQTYLKIPQERHLADVRRVSNDEKLYTIAYNTLGRETSAEWRAEGKRAIPLMPRLIPQTELYGIATAAASVQARKNLVMSHPSTTSHKTRVLDRKEMRPMLSNVLKRKNKLDTNVLAKLPKLAMRKQKFTSVKFVRPPIPLSSSQSAPSKVIAQTTTAVPQSLPMSVIHASVSSSISNKPIILKSPTKVIVSSPAKTSVVQPLSSGHNYAASPQTHVMRSPTPQIRVPISLQPRTPPKAISFITPKSDSKNTSSVTGLPLVRSIVRPVITTTRSSNVVILPSPIRSAGPIVTPKTVSQPITLPTEGKMVAVIQGATSGIIGKSPSGTPVASGSSSSGDSPKAKAQFKLPTGNVIEIQASAETLNRLVRSKHLTQDLIEILQKSVNMAGNKQDILSSVKTPASIIPATATVNANTIVAKVTKAQITQPPISKSEPSAQ